MYMTLVGLNGVKTRENLTNMENMPICTKFTTIIRGSNQHTMQWLQSEISQGTWILSNLLMFSSLKSQKELHFPQKDSLSHLIRGWTSINQTFKNLTLLTQLEAYFQVLAWNRPLSLWVTSTSNSATNLKNSLAGTQTRRAAVALSTSLAQSSSNTTKRRNTLRTCMRVATSLKWP